MDFISPTLDNLVDRLKQLNPEATALWGQMSLLRMIEHLTDSVQLSIGRHSFELEIPEQNIERAQQFLISEHPMPKEFAVKFATPEMGTRNTSIDAAIEEFKVAWNLFEVHYAENPQQKTLHPNFGELNYTQWLRLHSKHITHHLSQFGS